MAADRATPPLPFVVAPVARCVPRGNFTLVGIRLSVEILQNGIALVLEVVAVKLLTG
jgi:hypothetical protein